MMDKASNESSRASGSSQSFSQPSHLCQACLSVLARDKLELKRWYPHHTSLDSFIEASHTSCYVCSHLFSDLDIDERKNLKRVAQGKAPDERTSNEIYWGYYPSDFIENLPDPVKKGDHSRVLDNQTIYWASFTMMQLTTWSAWEASYANLGDATYWLIRVRLNSMYEAYIPLHLTAYRSSLRELWKNVEFQLSSTLHAPLVLTQRGMLTIALTRRHTTADQK